MTTVLNTPDQKVILKGVRWETYERLLAEHQDCSGTHFTYDRGMLEIMVLSFEHETLKETIAKLFDLLADERDLDFLAAGSTTFRRKDLGKGFEPDACFYIRNASHVRGRKRIDLKKDPPPDLALEVDVTSPSLDKFPLFAAVGIPEVWRYSDESLRIFRLESNAYIAQPESSVLPGVTAAALTDFVRSSRQMTRTAWIRYVRESIQRT